MSITVKSYPSVSASDPTPKTTVCATFEDYPNVLGSALLQAVVEKLADRFVEENYTQLAAKLDQQAVANLAVAGAGKKIAEEIRTRPVVYRERGSTYHHFSTQLAAKLDQIF